MAEKVKCAEAYRSYGEYYDALRSLAAEYGDMPMDSIMAAWTNAAMATNPMIQNSRVKHISSFPHDYGKEEIVNMLKAPDSNEEALREASAGLEWTAYPYRKIRETYQGINTYHYYHYPAYLDKTEAKSEILKREGRLLDKFNRTLRPDRWARQILGQAIQEGKVAYVPRWSIDKSHNQIGYAFLQQIPSDWFKIVGFNSESKYTVMFNMVYFVSVPGADWRQFGDLFQPYLDDFESILDPIGIDGMPNGLGKKFVYASYGAINGADGRRWRVDMDKFREIRKNAAGNPQLYNQNGRWAYWVTLPVDKCWVFEIDDTTRTAASPLTGLFLSFDQMADLEDVQLSILQNPLVSIGLGEIPYTDSKDYSTSDPYKLSPAGRATYLAYWYQMLAAANTSGIGMYFAPVNNLHIESLQEAPNATNISSAGYSYAIQKSGLSGLIPINSDPRAGAVNVSAALEENFCVCIYRQMEAMMESIYRSIGTKYEWRFCMFGGFMSDEKELENTRKGLQIGMLSETMKYLALRGISLWEDIGISNFINESGILDLRIPLVSSYNMKQETSGLPPQAAKDPDNEGGRPTKSIDEAIAEGGEAQEGDIDYDA